MSNILNGSINLEKLVCAKIKTKKGANALVIPLDANHIFSGEKGSYINVSVFINDEVDEYGNIASIKQNGNVPKGKKWADLTEEQVAEFKALPYLGNLKGKIETNGFEDAKEADPETDDFPF